MSARDDAVGTLQHYFRGLAHRAGYPWGFDNDAEIAAAVDNIIDAAKPERPVAKPLVIRVAKDAEARAILTAYALHVGETEAVPDCTVYIREHYMTDSPGYTGQVALIHWAGAPEFVTTAIWEKGAWAIREAKPSDALARKVQGIIERHAIEEQPEPEDYDDTESAYNNGHEVASWEIVEELRAALRAVVARGGA